MGNNSSKAASRSNNITSVDSISKPKSLYAASDHDYADSSRSSINRRATTRAPPGGSQNLGIPATAGSHHRRSRSAVASSPRVSEYDAPPRYSVAVQDSIGKPDPDLLGVPQSSDHGARRNSWSNTSAGQSHPQRPVSGIPPEGVPPASAAERAANLRRPMRQNSVEDALDTLRKYNTVIIVDDSGSMEGARWQEARDALAALADIASKYDADGIDVCFLNNKHVGTNMKDSELVRRLFDHVRPSGITPIGEKLEVLLLYYLDTLEHAKSRYDAGDEKAMKAVKPVNYIIITDGAPTDDPEAVIVAAARRLDAHNFPLTQVGIQFVQIGDNPEATAFLNELDNGLSQTYGIRDIVDTTPYTGGQLNAEMIIKILLGGVNKRVDRRGGQSVM